MSTCLLVSSCRSSKQTDYPGFSRVAGTSSAYLINKDNVATDLTSDDDTVTFTTILLQSNGDYQMLQMATDCTSRLIGVSGTIYQPDGRIESQIEADKEASAIDPNSDMGKVAMNACEIAMGKRSFSGEFEIQKALTVLFGNYDPSTQSSSVSTRSDSGTESGKLTVLLESHFSQDGTDKHLLVTSTAIPTEDCHACGTRIGAYLFANRAGQWTPEITDKQALQFGAWGNPGKPQSIKFAPNVYGFSLTLGDMGQGDSGVVEQFVAPVGNHYRPVLLLNLEADDAGNCGSSAIPSAIPCYQNNSTMRFLDSSHRLNDIEVDQTGTQLTDQGIAPARGPKLYFFDGIKYVEQASSSEIVTPPNTAGDNQAH